MPLPYNTDRFLSRARLAIAGALANPEILEALASVGFTAERISQGQALYEAVLASIEV